ncbi:hypothetical protein BU15DRAFT_73082 [Melanogaster broomeanus]|nr:hypothetical protein BU15DRAFT_73082 [Melanogaster broomeanus]
MDLEARGTHYIAIFPSIHRCMYFSGAGGHTVLREHEPRPILSDNITLRELLYLFAIGGLSVKGCSTLVDKYKEECADVPPLALCEHLGNRTSNSPGELLLLQILFRLQPSPNRSSSPSAPVRLCFVSLVKACSTGSKGNLSYGSLQARRSKGFTTCKMWPSDITSIALTFFQIALFDLLISLGLKPSGIVGHSVGEMAVLYASGAIPRSMQLSNSRLFVNVTGDGANGYTNKRCHVRYIELTHTPP